MDRQLDPTVLLSIYQAKHTEAVTENVKLQAAIVALEKENKQLKQQNLKLQEGRKNNSNETK